MKQVSDNEKQAVGYLLGEMDEAERDLFEERFFADEDLSASLDAAENDLVDEYLRGELDAGRKQKFERDFLISERRREKLRAARILQREVFAEESAPFVAIAPVSFWQRFKETFALPRIVWAGGLAAVVLLILLGGIWLVRRNDDDQIVKVGNENQNVSINSVNQTPPNSNLPQVDNQNSSNANEKSQSNSAPPQNVNQNPANVQEKPKTSPSPQPPQPVPSEVLQSPRIFAFTLLPPIRSGEKPVLIVPHDAQTVRLRVVHNNQQEFAKYIVELRNSDGAAVFTQTIPVTKKTLERPFTLNIRSGALAPGSYELTLRGASADGRLQEINFYNFTIQKK